MIDGRFRPLPSLGLIVLWFLASACTGAGGASRNETSSTSEAAPVQELASIATLREAFNHDAGKVRLVLLISPT